MWGQVVRLGVMVEVLGAVGEVKARHASLRTFTGQVQLGEVLGQARADGAKDPVQVAVAFDTDALVREVPNLFAPGLQLDELEVRAAADLDFDNAGVHGLSFTVCRGS